MEKDLKTLISFESFVDQLDEKKSEKCDDCHKDPCECEDEDEKSTKKCECEKGKCKC